jgi:hypothetical protein
MPAVLQHKVVAALPGTLEANSIYYVRVGAGFDLYVTNDAGTVVAYPLNSGSGAGEPAVQIVTIDFGVTGQYTDVHTVADAAATATKTVLAWPLPHPDLDTAVLDPMIVTGIATAGNVSLVIGAVLGRLVGVRRCAYQLLGA